MTTQSQESKEFAITSPKTKLTLPQPDVSTIIKSKAQLLKQSFLTKSVTGLICKLSFY